MNPVNSQSVVGRTIRHAHQSEIIILYLHELRVSYQVLLKLPVWKARTTVTRRQYIYEKFMLVCWFEDYGSGSILGTRKSK
jgi:hypothetical protein